ncbi:peptide chain release factor N(5)-glutamine methyltransferase [Rhizobium oryzicola]|uniref:Release factor glutamine methyltransferase n=1 Tax=Rhizobium oryzicola TaxID=1232668 RepID=A0ABT8T0J3_9HYPH|nr:peptide chain release factor N(5)-glutamine methyltransferase [Rhizobium oryzicola]MDO1584146.1 peptide chain release factor N(5)-glutamine methyltransferase [Rhizobium oryzicola]
MSRRLADIVMEARQRIAAAGLPDAAIDARHLVAGLLELNLTDLVVSGDRALTQDQIDIISAAVARRIAREPVHRILGHRDFHGVRLHLSPATLEPRPDTEVLVDAIVPHARRMAATQGRVSLIDLGTGTGAIALALLAEIPEMQAVGVDLSAEALETARRNADVNGVGDRFRTVESRWFEKISGSFDIIVSNPPYIKTEVIGELEPDVRHYDPMLALDGGPDGLDAYRELAMHAPKYLAPQGIIGLEIGYDQREAVSALFQEQNCSLIEALRDLGGQDRVLLFEK